MSAHWIFGRSGAAVALATVLAGCAPTGDEGTGKPVPTEAAAAQGGAARGATQAEAAPTIETLTHAQLTVPAAWSKKTTGGWTVFTSSDGVSHVAMAQMESADTSAGKIQEAGALIGASSLVMIDEQATSFGPEKLPARAADGTCKIGAAETRIGYVVVDLGGGNRVMAVHAAPKDLTDEQLEAGRRTVASLRRR